MSQAIDGFGKQFPPSTQYSQTLVLGGDLPAGGPQPPPSTVQAAINDSNLATDTFTQSKAATVLISSTATQAPPPATPAAVAPAAVTQTSTSAPTQAQNPSISVTSQDTTSDASPLQQFEQSQGPPPYTLHNAEPNPNKTNAQPLQPQPLNPFQIRQFSDLLKTIRSITSTVLPNFSFSA